MLMAVAASAPFTVTAHEPQFTARDKLKAHSDEFRQRVEEVAEGIYVAVGYSASNVALIQTKTGSIIIDTAANPKDARAIIKAFGDRLVRPIQAIVYTHNHPDHTGGAAVFAADDDPQIYSHGSLLSAKPDTGRGRRDGGDAFGTSLADEQFINAGTQLEYGRKTPHTREGFLPPTQTFDAQRSDVTISGVRLQLIHTPGEADENIAIWLPDREVVFSGDLILKTFPNIAPLRGLPTRPVDAWIQSLNTILSLHAKALVPGHMGSIRGTDQVEDALTAYRDGIAFVRDETMTGIREGLTVQELVESVKLPSNLAQSPYLQEYYGTVEWAVRGIYAQHVGWFDGNPTNIFPLPNKVRAQHVISMAGGIQQVIDRAEQALAEQEFQWAAELVDYVLIVETRHQEATGIKIRALKALGERQLNATARNYYLTVAQSLEREMRGKGE